MTREEFLQRRTEFAVRGQALPQAKLLDMDVISIRSAVGAGLNELLGRWPGGMKHGCSGNCCCALGFAGGR